MLSHTIAMPATISTTAMMNMAPLISTTKEFAENSCDSMTSSTQYQEKQQRGITSGKGGASNK
jgi:hypothetical protein